MPDEFCFLFLNLFILNMTSYSVCVNDHVFDGFRLVRA